MKYVKRENKQKTFKQKNISTYTPLCMNLFGPTKILSLRDNKYRLVILNDYTLQKIV